MAELELEDVVPHMVAQLERDLAKLPVFTPRAVHELNADQLVVHTLRVLIRDYRRRRDG